MVCPPERVFLRGPSLPNTDKQATPPPNKTEQDEGKRRGGRRGERTREDGRGRDVGSKRVCVNGKCLTEWEKRRGGRGEL
jgi:hypothetical protein